MGKIAFTGSTAVGRDIGERAARDVKQVTLELGGKSPSIVFADADLRDAAHGLAGAVLGNTGQDCCARSRVFVERGALSQFMEHLEAPVALQGSAPEGRGFWFRPPCCSRWPTATAPCARIFGR